MSESPFAPQLSGSGEFFKAQERMNDLAIIFDFKKVLKDQPHTYEGVASTRDVAVADVYAFRNSEDIEGGTPSLVQLNCQITNQVLVDDVEKNDWIGKVALQTIRKVGRAYVYRGVDHPGAAAAAGAFYQSLSETPDFD